MNKQYYIFISLLVIFFVFISPPRVSAQNVTNTKFGMFYVIWHCPEVKYISPDYGIPDVTEILAGNQTQANSPKRDSSGWAPIPLMHFWGKPALGYYCLADNETVLRQHAKQLHDLGVDFVFIDSTNQPRVDWNSQLRITQPFDKLLQVWSTIPDAPKIVVWVPVTDWLVPGLDKVTDQKMVEYLTGKLKQYPNLQFTYQGKPLLLVVDNKGFMPDDWMPINETELQQLSADYTVRRMWGLEPSMPANHWSFLQRCAAGFKASGGTQTCNQAVSTYNGSLEQISVGTAYQDKAFMSDFSTAVPKFDGRTLQKQFQTVFSHPGVPIVTIDGWNEFMASRFCLAGNDWTGSGDPNYCNETNDHFPDGNRIFVDQYNKDYNRDIEPAENDRSVIYYQIAKACIALYKSGGHCDSSNTSNLCCTVPTYIHGSVFVNQCDNSYANITGWATDDRDHTKKLTVRAEVYPDNEPYNKVSFTGTADIFFDGLNTVCPPDGKCSYGIKINSLPLSFKDKKLRVHVFGVAADSEMELNMIKVPNNIFGPCNNLISSYSPKPMPTPKPGDLNNDGKVDIFDYNLLVANFGKTGLPGFSPADIDKNGKVDIFDYNILVGNFGK